MSNILQKSSGLDDRIIEESIHRLTKKSNQLKGEIYELVKQSYVEFQSYVDSTVGLEKRLQEVTAEYGRLSGKIEQDLRGRVAKSANKRTEVEAKLQETQEKIDLLRNLVSVYHTLETTKTLLQSEQFSKAASQLDVAARELDDMAGLGCDAKVFLALQSELSLATSSLVLRLQEEWARFVSWCPKGGLPENPKLATFLKVELRVPARSGLNVVAWDEVVLAMRKLTRIGMWGQKVESFGQKLLSTVVRPLVTHPQLRALRVQEKAVTILKLTHCGEEAASPSTGAIVGLYESLGVVFSTLQQVVPKKYQQEWMAGIGGVVCPEMAELIVKHCLSTSIPKDSSELTTYKEIGTKTAKFEAMLVDVGVVGDEFDQLTEYTKNVNIHFATQKCRDLLVKARSILMKPLHDTVSIKHDHTLERLSFLKLSPGGDKPAPATEKKPTLQAQMDAKDLDALTFKFPACCVSASTQEYVELIYSTLRECCTSPSPCAIQFFYSVRNMVELFCAVLPSHHRCEIAELPRVAAIVHNNSMFLAHNLLVLGHQFHSRLPPPLNSQVATFIDQVTVIRQLGEECFLAEMRKQSGIVQECLKVSGTLDDVSSEPKRTSVQRGIQQAMLQVKKLSKVYAEILPTEVHHKAVGALLNVLTADVIAGVEALEDITMDDAVELGAIVSLILEAEPSYLQPAAKAEDGSDGELVGLYCGSWNKLKELGFVLQARLLDIVDRWGSGTGPLAQQFSPTELRGLIKALFQNTERRAAALGKITA